MKKIAVLTSGGDAPGMNACIRAVVRTAHYFGLEVYGVNHGFNGIIKGDFVEMTGERIGNIIQTGGTILKTSRSSDFHTDRGRQQAYNKLKEEGVEGLVVIGGNGTFAGALKFCDEYDIPCIGVPGTIDNDLYGTDNTIGYDTAVNTALNALDNLTDTAESHGRVFFVEVMGRDTGYIAINSMIACGAEWAMIPELDVSTSDIINSLQKESIKSRESRIIIVAEDGSTGKATKVALEVSDRLPDLDIKVITLGHIQRGGAPSAYDRVLASQLGTGAVTALLKGRSSVMAGVINGCLTFTSFSETISNVKPVSPEILRLMEVLGVLHRNKEEVSHIQQ